MAETAPAATLDAVAETDGHVVLLDGKPIRTSGRSRLVLPSAALAAAIADEWAAQGATIDPAAMPMMTLAATALDRVVPQARAVAGDAASYAGSDLLCYRATGWAALSAAQSAGWDPLLDWAAETYGARLKVTEGVMPISQDNTALMLFARALGQLDPFRLTAVHVMTTAMGSLVLSLAVHEGRLPPGEAFQLSTLDEAFQAERWGEDAEGKARLKRLKREIEDAHGYLRLL